MAGKKAKKNDRSWHKKVMGVFADQKDKSAGMHYDDVREVMGLGEDDEGYEEISDVMMNLRDQAFLAHKFTHASLKDDFFLGSPADIPNILKRDAGGVLQTVFFLAPGALGLKGEKLEEAVESGELPNSKLPDGVMLFTRDTIAQWLDGLGEVIDLYVTDKAFQMQSAKMLQALMPTKKK